jgi:dodecin
MPGVRPPTAPGFVLVRARAGFDLDSAGHVPRCPTSRETHDGGERGVDDAIRNGLARAAQTLRHLDWFEVTEVRGQVVGGAPSTSRSA